MNRSCSGALQIGRRLYQQLLRKFKKYDDENFDSDERTAFTHSTDRIPDSGDNESTSTARLSRRSSLLVDLASLFHRSSSVKPVSVPGQLHDALDENEEEEDEDVKKTSKEWVLETIRQKKETIVRLRSQPWSMKRKRRALKIARRYLKRQQSKVSRWHLYKVEAIRQWVAFGRWYSNMKIYLIPWEAKIKKIESHYGSVVSSYFTFLRWVLSLNITMTIIMMLFVTIPEWLADSRADPERFNRTYHIKFMKEKDIPRADELNTILDFKGYFEYSLLFYGYYSSETYFGDTIRYSVPVAYFFVNLFILGYSFFIILQKMASNARQSKLAGGKAEQYVFNWKLFAGWDYSIGNAETAANFVMANVNKFREIIAEYNVDRLKKFDIFRFTLRVLANILIFAMQAGSVWAILAVSQMTTKTSFIQRNAVSITVSFITLTFPNFFDLISKMERYHPRTALRLQLGRVLFLYILNYYTLIISLMFMLNTMESQRTVGEHLIPVPQYSGHHYNKAPPVYNTSHSQIMKHRAGRQVVFEFPSAASSIFNRSKFKDIQTTPPPNHSWTTVYPNFGPFGVANPKAVVSESQRGLMNASTFIVYPIGNTDWTRNISAKPTFLNYSTTVQAVLSAARLSTDWYEECWENLIGEEITKLVTTDLVMTIASIMVIDFFRALWVRYTNIWWFWNLETTFPEYGEFKVAENVLHLVNNQGMIWLGLFFVPMLPAINNIKLIILMYIRGWAVMTCNVPARQIFRASRSSNFYLMLLLLMLFLCTLPVGYVIASKKPSKICGPFGSQERFYSVIVQLLDRNLTKGLVDAIKYMISPGIVIPVLLLLLLTIYFLFALVRGLREANTDLTKQLLHERTEEKKRIFELAGGGKKRSGANHSETVRTSLLTSKTSASNGAMNKVNNVTDDKISSDQSFIKNKTDLLNYVPSLPEPEESESDDKELDLNVTEENNEKAEKVVAKRGWKQKLITWLGLDEKPKRKKRQRYNAADIEEGYESDRKSPISHEERSITSVIESYLHGSASFEKLSGDDGQDKMKLNHAEPVRKVERAVDSQRTRQTVGIDESLMGRTISSVKSGGDDERATYRLPQEEQQQQQDKLHGNMMNSCREASNEIEDPRFLYANPYSSYTNAMMSPLMEMQALAPTIYSESEVEVEDEFDANIGSVDPNRRDLKPDEANRKMKASDANATVHPEIHSPVVLSPEIAPIEHGKEGTEQSSPVCKITQCKVESRIYVRDTKPKPPESKMLERSPVLSDPESPMIASSADPQRLYYTDSECVTTIHGRPSHGHGRSTHYTVPHYATVSNAQDATQADVLQQFLMRVSINEDRSGIVSHRLPPHQPVSVTSPSTVSSRYSQSNQQQQQQQQMLQQQQQQQRPLPPSETNRIRCKHTLV